MIDESEGDSENEQQVAIIDPDYEPMSSDTDDEQPTTHQNQRGMRGPLKFLEEMARFHRYWRNKNQLVGLSRRDSIDCEIRQAFRAIRHAALIEEMRPHVYILYKLLDRCFYQLKRNRRASQTPNLCQRYLAQMAVVWPEYKSKPKFKLVAIEQSELDSKVYEPITLLIEGDAHFRTKLLNKMKRYATDIEAVVILDDDLTKDLIPPVPFQPLDPIISATAELLITQIFAKEAGMQELAPMEVDGQAAEADQDELQAEMDRLAADYPEMRLWSSPRVRRIEPTLAPNNGQIVQQALAQESFQVSIGNSNVALPAINKQFAAATANDNQLYIVSRQQLANWLRCEEKLATLGIVIAQP
jgi:hypothetical protein